jgi:Zn-dependent peptidase ImmA (M78 family)
MIEIIDMLPTPGIKQKAEEILAKIGIIGDIPVPVEKIVEYLGFECYLFKPNAQTIDISGAVNHRNKKIFINASDPPKRQLFTVAHEIGHILLEGAQEDYIDYRRNSLPDKKEKEADYFAGCLLMPEDIFSYQWKLLHGDINKLSELFGVSTPAIAVRANTLGLG